MGESYLLVFEGSQYTASSSADRIIKSRFQIELSGAQGLVKGLDEGKVSELANTSFG